MYEFKQGIFISQFPIGRAVFILFGIAIALNAIALRLLDFSIDCWEKFEILVVLVGDIIIDVSCGGEDEIGGEDDSCSI